MMHTSTPFEQFAQNANGASGIAGTFDYASGGINLQAGLPALRGLGAMESTPMAYGLLVLGAAGFGAAIAQAAHTKPSKYGIAASGAMLQGGAVAAIVGIFGASLSTTERAGFGALGLGLLAGSFFTSRR